MAQPCRLVEISGTPYDRGFQYGREASREIGRAVAHYGAQAKALNMDEPGLARKVREYLPVLEGFDHRQVEEMRGIAWRMRHPPSTAICALAKHWRPRRMR